MNTQKPERTALILGATGGVGHETAKALAKRGWRIRAIARRIPADDRGLTAAEWVQGDAMNPHDVMVAAKGVSVIFHGVNPPAYRDWDTLVLPMQENAIAAAKQHDARLLLPGTLYNFGPDAFPLLGEGSPQNPLTRKGRIRLAMERRLEQATQTEGLRALILCCHDFFGPRRGNSWFSEALVRPGKPVRSVRYPGDPKIGHGWAYLPDVGETFARLMDREADLRDFERFHFGGHWFEHGGEFAERIMQVAGAPRAPIRQLPWVLLRLLSPFVGQFREMQEMRYLWEGVVRLDNRKLVEFLGCEPHTDIEMALRSTLTGLGCLTPTGDGTAQHRNVPA